MMKKFPRLSSAYISLFCDPDTRQELEGDILSNYHWRLENGQSWSASLHLIRDVALTARFLFSANNGPSVVQIMQSSMKVYARNARKNSKVYLFNLLSLYIGILCFLAIYSFYQFENSYDSAFNDADQLYRIEKIEQDQEKRVNGTSYLLDQFAREQVSGIADITGVINSRFDRINLQYPEGTPWHALHHMVVRDNFFNLFDFQFLEGRGSTAFENPRSIVITQKTRNRLFNGKDALGEMVLLNERPFQVTGVVKLPENSHFEFDYLLDFDIQFASDFWDKPRLASDWHYAPFIFNYAKVTPGQEAQVTEQLTALYASNKADDQPEASFLLHPVIDIHLDPSTDWELEDNGNRSFVNMMMILGLIILLLVAINYSFMNIAQVGQRLKEFGLRSVLGSSKGNLISVIIIENTISILLASILAYASLFRLDGGLPFDFPIEIHSESLFNLPSILPILGLALGMSLLASFSPIILVRKFQPIPAIQGRFTGKFGNSNRLKILMAIQVVISLCLIISMVFFHQQLSFILNKDPGFEVKNLGYMERYDRGENRPSFDSFKEALLEIPGIKSVTSAAQLPLKWPAGNNYRLVLKGKEEGIMTSRAWIDYDYFKTLNIPIKAGREYSREFPSDTSGIVVSESAVRELGIADSPLGKVVKIFFRGGDIVREKRIIGVVSDFNYRTLHTPLRPHYYFLAPNGPNVTVNFEDINNSQTIERIEAIWDEFSPAEAFNFTYMDSHFRGQYESDLAQRNAIYVLAGIILLLASMGIFGISAYIAQKSTKALSIRKVLGAKVRALYLYQARQYIIICLVSFLISLAPVYFLVSAWLESYAYRIHIAPANFGIGFLIVLGIVVLVITGNIMKIALLNPVNTLKDE